MLYLSLQKLLAIAEYLHYLKNTNRAGNQYSAFKVIPNCGKKKVNELLALKSSKIESHLRSSNRNLAPN
uniref:Uncharacterized protein n=1 Tax=Nelumbo nucifera TaxID=4432 RepID=A0A822ZJN5_NELNU|nr:TPA_asm: hypothetical protein HUJ06_002051 [Nelumbo nucifera]